MKVLATGRPESSRVWSSPPWSAGREVTAADLPPGFEPPPGQPEGLGAMFAEYDRHGFHGVNSLVLRAILGREPRSVAEYVGELGIHSESSAGVLDGQ